MLDTHYTPTFDHVLNQVFKTYGANYHPNQHPEAVELRLASGQSLVFTEGEDQQLVIIADLGECPTAPEKLILLLMANHQGLEPELPHRFFVDSNMKACVSLSLPLTTTPLNKIQQALEHLVSCCQWFLTLTSETVASEVWASENPNNPDETETNPRTMKV